jgi:CIC family chloride channel protein
MASSTQVVRKDSGDHAKPRPRFKRDHFGVAVHVAIVAVPVGVVVGAAVAAYDYIVNALLWDHFTTWLPAPLLCLLPLAGMLLTGAILSLFKVSSPSMADEVVRAYHEPDKGIDYKAALPKLAASVATMGFGCSAGMEGASKWLGGTVAAFIQRTLNRVPSLHVAHGRVETTLLAGAAAGIGAIFRAPLTGAIMGIESPFKRDLAHEALIHGLVASALSYATFCLFRPSTPYFPIHFTYAINLKDLLLCVPVGVLAGMSSHAFLACLNSIKRGSKRLLSTPMQYLLGGVLLSAIAWVLYAAVGEPSSLQAGLPVANRLLNGQYAIHVCLLVFLAKLLATAITFGMGGVGGLFVPSATIGAALGAACDILLQPSQPGLFTFVGIAAFTGASYNSLLFAAVFVAEATGSPALVVPSLLASCAAFLVSAGVSNSQSQKSHRPSSTASLAITPCRFWMTTTIIAAKRDERIDSLLKRTGKRGGFKEVPVIEADGTFIGMASISSAYLLPPPEQSQSVMMVTRRRPKVVLPTTPMLEIEKIFSESKENYLSVIDPTTERLVGVLSPTDVVRARRALVKEMDEA